MGEEGAGEGAQGEEPGGQAAFRRLPPGLGHHRHRCGTSRRQEPNFLPYSPIVGIPLTDPLSTTISTHFFYRAPFSLSLPSDQIASIFEYTYQNPIFSVVPPTSFLYKPILGIFVFTGLPLSAYLFYEAIKSANELSESMDKQDGV